MKIIYNPKKRVSIRSHSESKIKKGGYGKVGGNIK